MTNTIKNVGECRYAFRYNTKYGGSPKGGQRIGRNPEQQEQQEQQDGKLTRGARGEQNPEQTPQAEDQVVTVSQG
jgi:hypothetical protein